jgi:group II intron reverse transcriptase/maturase
MVLEAIYEQDFLDCSYGFRPGRSAHQALDRLREGLTKMGGGVVIELDIKSFFDSVSHGHLRDFLDQRVRDGDIRRAIDKWLNAGVLEAGAVMHPDQGTPQGGVISPLLANIFLHEVLDRWFESEVKPRLAGEALLIRYADDAVIVLAKETDAQRVMRVLPKRFERYGLMLHPEKTRMVPFRRPRAPLPGRGRGTFDLLGFTHYWGRSRKGYWVVKRKTAASRLRRALLTIGLWCRKNRHLPVAEQQQGLNQKLRGHYGYFGITGNFRALAQLIEGTRRHWQRWLNRRSQRAHMPWERFNSLLKQYPLARPRVVHSVYGRAVSP